MYPTSCQLISEPTETVLLYIDLETKAAYYIRIYYNFFFEPPPPSVVFQLLTAKHIYTTKSLLGFQVFRALIAWQRKITWENSKR
jgi:hypothetical protein